MTGARLFISARRRAAAGEVYLTLDRARAISAADGPSRGGIIRGGGSMPRSRDLLRAHELSRAAEVPRANPAGPRWVDQVLMEGCFWICIGRLLRGRF